MDVEFSEVFDLIVNVGADQLFDDVGISSMHCFDNANLLKNDIW